MVVVQQKKAYYTFQNTSDNGFQMVLKNFCHLSVFVKFHHFELEKNLYLLRDLM